MAATMAFVVIVRVMVVLAATRILPGYPGQTSLQTRPGEALRGCLRFRHEGCDARMGQQHLRPLSHLRNDDGIHVLSGQPARKRARLVFGCGVELAMEFLGGCGSLADPEVRCAAEMERITLICHGDCHLHDRGANRMFTFHGE